MNCPACGNVMTEMAAGSVKVQACKGGCGGLWFDEWKIGKVDEPGQSAGEALLSIERDPSVTVDPKKRYKCPRDATVMMRHFWSVKRDVVVDECPKCEGVFLDPGELAQIRGDYQTDADRHKAAKAYYGEMFDKQIADLVANDETKIASARKITSMFRFISPRYFIASKDAWSALDKKS